MFGAYSSEKSRIVASSPARTWSHEPAARSAAVGQNDRPAVGARSEKWMWQELPSRSFGFAMNVSATPSCAAISFAPFL